MANLHKVKRFLSDRYGIVVASQIDSSIFHNTQGVCVDFDTPLPNVFDLRSIIASSNNIPSGQMNTLCNILNTPHTHDEAQTGAYKQALSTFNNTVTWLWGSVLQGGFYVCKVDGYVCIGEVVGHYTNNTHERFIETHNASFWSEAYFSSIAFGYLYSIPQGGSYDSGTYETDTLLVMGIQPLDNVTAGTCITRKAELVDLTWTYPQSTEETHTSLSTALSNKGVVGLLNSPTPRQIITSGWVKVAGNQWYDSETYILPNYIHDYGEWYGDTEVKKQPDMGDGVSDGDGGSDGFNEDTDKEPITPASQFTTDGINSGMITLYNPTSAEVQDFCNFLFSGITENMSAVLKRLVVSPLEYVISLNMCHFMPTCDSSSRIKFCGIDSGVTSFKISKQFEKIDCGTLSIPKQFYGFLDYGGFSSAKLYLPYCGIFPINIDEIMGGSIHIAYWVDLMSGSCNAQVEITNSDQNNLIDNAVLYEFTGNCFESMPLSATDYRGTVQGLMNVVSGVAAVAMGQPAGMGAIASGVLSMKPDVIHGGNMSTSFGYMGKQSPYIILSRPVKKPPLDFNYMRGYPANITKTIDWLTKNEVGYCEIVPNTLDLENIAGITDSEKEELQTLLTNGVFF